MKHLGSRSGMLPGDDASNRIHSLIYRKSGSLWPRQTVRLACDQIFPVLAKIKFPSSFCKLKLKKLSLSLSFHERRRPELEYMESSLFEMDNRAALCLFLHSCPDFEYLKLRTYSLSRAGGLSPTLRSELFFLNQISESSTFSDPVESISTLLGNPISQPLVEQEMVQTRCLRWRKK